ncbi:hypothetical protein J2Z32_003491 [Paenibacillus turicensis]|uniref:Phage protein n=1 Tax=Paenibacillus turicensis TaxID=160487 RepID=A0ABS4FW70_9BACL|nr:hypothetical protein [Paenibacillus turicensis]MBP1906827.1 hypothetical protein [Paenibacillus turicensis]
MIEIENFDITDIDGCEFAYEKGIGKMIISWHRDFDGYPTGKVRIVYSDGSGRAKSVEEAQRAIDNGEWIIYRKQGYSHE